MKKYRIPVTHTATTVVEHVVEAKSMQDAMFRLGQAITDAPDPFECVVEAGVDIETSSRPSSPEIISDPTALDLDAPAAAATPVP